MKRPFMAARFFLSFCLLPAQNLPLAAQDFGFGFGGDTEAEASGSSTALSVSVGGEVGAALPGFVHDFS
jgi:hypothetical protein